MEEEDEQEVESDDVEAPPRKMPAMHKHPSELFEIMLQRDHEVTRDVLLWLRSLDEGHRKIQHSVFKQILEDKRRNTSALKWLKCCISKIICHYQNIKNHSPTKGRYGSINEIKKKYY